MTDQPEKTTPSTTVTEASPESTTTGSKSSRRIVVGTLIVLALIGGTVLVASKAGLDKALVKQQLDALAVQMKENGARQGRDVAFTYGDVAIKGGLTDRHAEISDPTLVVKPLEAEGFQQPRDPQTLRLTSEVLMVYPKAADLSSMTLSLPKPIEIRDAEDADKKLLSIEGATPIEVVYGTTKKSGVPYTEWSFDAPKEVRFTYMREQVAEGAEEQTPTLKPVYDTIVLTMESGKGALSVEQAGNLGEGSLEMKSLVLSPQSQPEAGRITIDQIVSAWDNTRNEQNLNVVHSSFAIDNVQADEKLLPYAPISAAMDVSYEGAMPTSQEEQAAIASSESAFKLKTFSITTKDATFNATADFVASPEDRLPVGMANVTLTNLPFIVAELKKFKLLDNDKEQLVATLLQQVTGTAYTDLKDVAVDVQRTRGGSFQIGKTTFEELFAALLQASMSKGKAPATVLEAPKADAADAPAAPAEEKLKVEEATPAPEETRG